ncbi:unnamed protein product [Gongylonema pulchrum]|uniref:Alpha-carbonic anhydrase domain-containing protein n=1 Tax=Gongylonema pulchrum TaxID=637853 RepID=A0A183F1F2_9BILA|nr:unnamed protein product [Gongylonema pulchrum]
MFDESVLISEKRITISSLKVWKLFASSADYITYEGSMTSPGCYETVTWIILNHPLQISTKDLKKWRKLQRTSVEEKEPQYVAPNFRPLQLSYGRLIRTNIIIKKVEKVAKDECGRKGTSVRCAQLQTTPTLLWTADQN